MNIIAINQQSNFLNVGTINNTMHTLCADHHGTPHAICYAMLASSAEPVVLNDQDGGIMSVSDKPSTLRAQMKHHEPIVCYAIEGNTVDRNCSQNGKGWCENVSPALNTQDKHAVVFRKDR